MKMWRKALTTGWNSQDSMLASRGSNAIASCSRSIHRQSRKRLSPGSRTISSTSSSPISSNPTIRYSTMNKAASLLAGASAVAFISYELMTRNDEMHLDAPSTSGKNVNLTSPTATLHAGIDQLGVFLWGSNKTKIVAPDVEAPVRKASILPNNTPNSSSQVIKKPRYLAPLSGQAFRDLALHETYAVAVTSKGDLLQWGTGYSEEATVPTPTLKGQNVVQVALTPGKIYARTKSGNVLIVPVSKKAQLDTADGKNPLPTISFLWRILGYSNPGVHFVKMDLANQNLVGGNKIIDISAGRSHLLALSSGGRGLCAAVDSAANELGQLGGPRLLEDISSRASSSSTEKGESSTTISESDIKYDTTLKEIPALRKLTLNQIVAGDRHSLALTSEGRVLGWGNNSLGQLALGNTYAFPTIPAPTEAPFAAGYPKTARVTCKKLYAGGDMSYFLVERQEMNQRNSKGDQISYTDLLAAGNGMYGGMGSGQYFSAGTPIKVKTVSGLSEFDESIQSVRGIGIEDVSVNSTHVAVVLADSAQDPISKITFGNDVFVFGHNADYQLGTGKRSNLAIPQHIPPLPYTLTQEVKALMEQKKSSGGKKEEESLDSGTVTHMPHNRLQLAPRKGKLEEKIVCGYGNTAVYWHTTA
ncbi:RCC1/BLIP-II [Cystobasidium minutum MCA 4210]|uniref:RCC1/BLIP-II n=1 Tax=Cystobasidium minutum MCA 4210 TaxID=1397322 RepID=UPI0034CF614C|eukprot:jgi/Rhomi1/212159/estExt_Genemark1.C_60035